MVHCFDGTLFFVLILFSILLRCFISNDLCRFYKLFKPSRQRLVVTATLILNSCIRDIQGAKYDEHSLFLNMKVSHFEYDHIST